LKELKQTLTHALYHLAAQPEYTEMIRQEIEPIIEKEGWTKTAMLQMQKLDSFLRESARLNPLGMSSVVRFFFY
jgi:cytochrome P450